MKVLSLFSGVGGFDLGLENAGMETVFQCEWDKHATKILERHWPDVPRWGDISTLTGRHILDHAPVIDVVAWGSPCQDLSVAGKRAGLKGERSGLFHEGIRIIKEIRELTNGKYPRISVWENVAGALSSGAGADFGQVLYEMDEAGACFSEWRLLDAQYFGVPQRRRRVFVVSVFDSATAERCRNPLLPVSEGVRWNPSQGRTTRQTTTRAVEQSLASGRGIANTISAELYHKSTVVNQDVNNGHLIVGSLAVEPFTPSSFAQYEQGVGTLRSYGGDLAGGSETLLVEPFVKAKRAQSVSDDETWVEAEVNPTINQFDAGDVRATTAIVFENSYRDAARISDGGITNTLSAKMGTGGNNTPMVAVPIGFSHTQGLSAQPSESAWPTLRTEGAGMAVAIPIQDGREIEKHQNGLGVASEGEPSYTLDQTGAQAVAYSIREDAKANTFSATEMDRANALNSLRPSPQSHHAQMFITESYDEYNDRLGGEVHHALRAGTKQSTGVVVPNQSNEPTVFQPGTMTRLGGGVWEGTVPTLRAEVKRGDNEPHVMIEPTMSVRRLTPLECERLMGWPDDWTAGQSDTHRYKQCGNGVASPVAQWIGEQIINL